MKLIQFAMCVPPVQYRHGRYRYCTVLDTKYEIDRLMD